MTSCHQNEKIINGCADTIPLSKICLWRILLIALISDGKTICQCYMTGCGFIRHSTFNDLNSTWSSVLQIIFAGNYWWIGFQDTVETPTRKLSGENLFWSFSKIIKIFHAWSLFFLEVFTLLNCNRNYCNRPEYFFLKWWHFPPLTEFI